MAVKTKRQQARDDKRIEAAYYRSCSGVQIDILDIPKVFKAGQELLDKGCTEPELEAGIRAAVEALNKKAADEAVTLALSHGASATDAADSVLKARARMISADQFGNNEAHKTGGA